MNTSEMSKDPSLKPLIELGRKGHYPLFHQTWFHELAPKQKKLTPKEKIKVTEIIEKLSKHRSIERKKILLLSLPGEERNIFMREFISLVEGQVLDATQGLQ